MTDIEVIDFLENMLKEKYYTGKCILRESRTGRGWRLHETSEEGASDTVREAIEKFAEQTK